ncbi:MAG: single-stranded DNA-binding protein [Clostridia bacterium]
MNKIILIGNLAKDPELKTTPNGVAVCSFTLAVSRRFAQGETDFIPIIVWRAQAENCAKYLRKGSKAAISGSLQIRTYDGNDGTKKYVTEVIADEVQFLNAKSEQADEPAKVNKAPIGELTQAVDDENLPF